MSRDRRKPWQIPVEYSEDRFPDKPSGSLDDQTGGSLKPDPDLVHDRVANPAGGKSPAKSPRQKSKPSPDPQPRPIQSGGWRDSGGGFATNDTEPMNYARGPHEGELDCDDKDEHDYEDQE
jgi:hypothetical protein